MRVMPSVTSAVLEGETVVQYSSAEMPLASPGALQIVKSCLPLVPQVVERRVRCNLVANLTIRNTLCSWLAEATM